MEFVSRILAGGANRAQHIVTTQRIRNRLPSNSDLEQVYHDNLCIGAAEAVGRLNSLLDTDAIGTMQEGFGNKTPVTLPCGVVFNTREITANTDAHHRNNRLAGSGSNSTSLNAFHPGMVDRLHPDYSNMAPEFIAACRSDSTLAQQLMQAARRISAPNIASARQSTTVSYAPVARAQTSATATSASMAELDNDLASSLAKANKSLEKPKNPMLFAYPFELSEISALNAVNGLTELNGDTLGVDTSVENGPPIMKTFVKGTRTHYVTIHKDDADTLHPGQKLNDAIVDFWILW